MEPPPRCPPILSSLDIGAFWRFLVQSRCFFPFGHFCSRSSTCLGVSLLNGASFGLCGLSDTEDFSKQAPLSLLGGFRNHLGLLPPGVEEEKYRIIQRCIVAPPDPTMAYVVMAIGYARTEDHTVRERIAPGLISRRHVMWLPGSSATIPTPVFPDQPPATLGTSTPLPIPCSFYNLASEVHHPTPFCWVLKGMPN